MEQGNTGSTELQQVIKIDTPRRALQEETNDFPRKLQFSCSTTCSFSKQEYNNSDAAKRSKTTVKLCGLIIVYTMVMVIEIVGGLRSNSLAILTDAVHLLSDIAVSLFLFFTRRKAYCQTDENKRELMFAIAAFGFIVNFLLVLWLGHDHSHHSHSHEYVSEDDDHHNHETEELFPGDGGEFRKTEMLRT
ncbi:hypothetical protein DH2020_000389 [Rehmannia glutinosa]|uniref:Cation efflux protein transmembrane domain-containing protein n=1 Tax=Rehmannia glutinosa TaxID=99300 RepID=A0ABR0XWC4_REHGL